MSERAIALVFAAALIAAPAANAELFKCVGADGKTTYSDTKCGGLGPEPAKKAAEPEEHAKGPSPEEAARLKALEKITVDPKTTNEQKTAAQLEAGNIRRGLEATLTAADKEKRAALTKDLANPDPARRSKALREIRTLYRE
jgi:uncharacterized protein DUF4124